MGRANAYADPSSEEYATYYEALTQPSLDALDARVTLGERGITAEHRQTERDIQNVGAGRGSARSPYATAAMGARAGEGAATQRANLQLEAGVETSRLLQSATQFMADMGNFMQRDAVAFAQEYIDNAAGIRDEFVDRMVAINLAGAEIAGSIAGAAMGQVGAAYSAAGRIGAAEVAADSAWRNNLLDSGMELAGVIAGIAMGGSGSQQPVGEPRGFTWNSDSNKSGWENRLSYSGVTG
jgi:hypothetical protein